MASAEASEQTVSVRIVSVLPEGEPQGTFSVPITPVMTGQDLLRKLCHESKVPLKPEYILESDSVVVAPETLLSSLHIQEGQNLVWNMADQPFVAGRKCWNSFWFMAVLSLVIGTIGLVAIIYIHLRAMDNMEYGIVFDAGSSHTSMFIYRWDADKVNSTAVAGQYGRKCNTDGGGISSFANNTSGAGQSLVKCLQQAKQMIPEDKYGDTPVYLGATAGMRLLEKENKNASDAVMAAVRKTIATYSFKFTKPETQARILTGREEGTFSWITSNYVTGAFHEDPPRDGISQKLIVKSVGALDLGGASTQISFEPNVTLVPDDYRFDMTLYGTNYSLYTHSYLCYGVNEAATRYQAILIKKANYTSHVENPCGPKGNVLNASHSDVFGSACVSGSDALQIFGYSITAPEDLPEDNYYTLLGVGNATECERLLTTDIFNFTAPCPYPNNSCSFNGVFQPPVQGDFYAFSAYFYLMQFLNLTTQALINHTDFMAAYQSLCNKSWDEVKNMHASQPQNLPWYCFQSLYANTLLVEGYKFDPATTWNSIHFVESISGTDAGWTLGFIINESNLLPSERVTSDLTTVTFILLTILFCAFLLLSIYFACHASRYHRAIRRKFMGKSYGAI